MNAVVSAECKHIRDSDKQRIKSHLDLWTIAPAWECNSTELGCECNFTRSRSSDRDLVVKPQSAQNISMARYQRTGLYQQIEGHWSDSVAEASASFCSILHGNSHPKLPAAVKHWIKYYIVKTLAKSTISLINAPTNLGYQRFGGFVTSFTFIRATIWASATC